MCISGVFELEWEFMKVEQPELAASLCGLSCSLKASLLKLPVPFLLWLTMCLLLYTRNARRPLKGG